MESEGGLRGQGYYYYSACEPSPRVHSLDVTDTGTVSRDEIVPPLDVMDGTHILDPAPRVRLSDGSEKG